VKLELNEQQRRHLAVVLDQVDAALLEVLTGAAESNAGAPPQRILRPLRRDIPATLAAPLLQAAARTRSRLGADISSVGLRAHPESLRRRVAAYLTSALILLEDCHSAAMIAYGEVDPALAGTLDPWLISLENEVNAMRRMLDARSVDGAPG
jgi:hypothetical protein